MIVESILLQGSCSRSADMRHTLAHVEIPNHVHGRARRRGAGLRQRIRGPQKGRVVITKEFGTTLLGAAIIGALVFVGWEIRQNTAALRGADPKEVSDLRGLWLPPDIQRDINDVFAEYEWGTGPGCVVGVVQVGRLTYARRYGIALMERDFTEAPRSPRASPSAGAGERAVVQASESTIASLAGSYESAELGATWVLEAADVDLLPHHPDGRTITLEARSETMFTGRGHELEFIREAGEVKGFVLGAGRV